MSEIDKNFSLDNFKKWMRKHNDEPKMGRSYNPLIGVSVESKINARKLCDKIQAEEGDIENLSEDFANNGGRIKEVDDKHFLIEVDTGSFYILRNYVRRS